MWRNRITLKYKTYQKGNDKQMELRSAPPAPIRYTSDGSDPQVTGAAYEDPFTILKGSPLILAYAEKEGIRSEVIRIPINWEEEEGIKVDPASPAFWRRNNETESTKASYEFLAVLRKFHSQAVGLTVNIGGEGGVRDWIQLTTFGEKKIEPDLIEEGFEALRKIQTEGQVKLECKGLYFEAGQDLLDLVAAIKTEIKPGEIKQ
jgi:hypothetical protein